MSLPVRVVGVGSPHGDDAVAWAVIALARGQGWPANVELHQADGGQRLLELLDGRGTLLLIDALAPAGNPGAVRRFVWPAAQLEVLRPGSTHDMRPGEALELAASLGLLPPLVVLWGVEGTCFDPCTDLSVEVATAVPGVVEALAAELKTIFSEKGHADA